MACPCRFDSYHFYLAGDGSGSGSGICLPGFIAEVARRDVGFQRRRNDGGQLLEFAGTFY